MQQRSKTVGYTIIILIFLVAFGVRMYRIGQPLLGFHPIRQFRTAILAQTYYYKNVESVPEWKKQLHTAYKSRIPLLEPPVGEIVTAGMWRIAGGEYLWLPRIISCVYWLIGGIFLYLIACRLISPGAAFFSILFYLFWPYNLFIARSIQPEAMLVMLYLCSVFLMLHYYDRPTITRLVPAAMAAGCAILIKPYIIFPVYAAFISLGIFKQGLAGFVRNPKSILFVFISLLAGGLYYGHSFLASENLGRRGQMQFVPSLYLTGRFWMGWLTMIGQTTGIVAFIAAIIGTFLCQKRFTRVFLSGLWAGYIIFGLLFNYAIHTHDYYQVPMIPIAALGLGPVCVVLKNQLCRLSAVWRYSLGVIGILILAVLGSMALKIRPDQFLNMNPQLKDKLETVCNFIGVNPHLVKRINSDYSDEVKVAAEIGEIINHSAKTFLLADREIRALMYYAQICGVGLPSSKLLELNKLLGRSQNAVRNFQGRYKRHAPEYLVVTDLEDFASQEQLKVFILATFGLVAETDKYLIFDLTRPIESHEGGK
ncbi:MAG: ArnT family glycosyltransferase [Planctomycetota bacterium]|jgi:hypothetical protein